MRIGMKHTILGHKPTQDKNHIFTGIYEQEQVMLRSSAQRLAVAN